MGCTFLHSILAKVRSRPLALSAPHLLRTALHTPSPSSREGQSVAGNSKHKYAFLSTGSEAVQTRETVQTAHCAPHAYAPKEITWRDIKAIAQKGNTFYRPSASPEATEHVEKRHSASRHACRGPGWCHQV